MTRNGVFVAVVFAFACAKGLPPKPGLSAFIDSNQHVSLNWAFGSDDGGNGPGPISGISIYRSETSHTENKDSKIADVDSGAQPWIDSGVQPGHTYYYVIAAKSDGGYG